MSSSARDSAPPKDELIRIYKRIDKLKNMPIPKWDEMMPFDNKKYIAKLSAEYVYKYKRYNSNIGDLYGLNKNTEEIKPIGLLYFGRTFLIGNEFALSAETTIPLQVCVDKPVKSVEPMKRDDAAATSSQNETWSNLVSETYSNFKDKCYEHTGDVCGENAAFWCFTLFELTPMLPTIAKVAVPYYADELKKTITSKFTRNPLNEPKMKTEGGSIKRRRSRSRRSTRERAKRARTKNAKRLSKHRTKRYYKRTR